MVAAGAILFGDRERFLRFDPAEHPLALQLGGADPDQLARCAELGAARGYEEINLNVGCPSDRVQNARFGACLMAEPDLVATCVRAMRAAAPVPVTVKTRIGIDAQDSYDFLRRFVDAVAGAGCRTVILHARKAWLSGLSPKENRELPPLRYEMVHRVKADFPELEIIANGGIRTIEQARAQLAKVDGVMIGREAYLRSLRARRVGARAAGHGGAGAQPVRRSSSACCRMSSASSPRARRWARSPGTFWGCSTACAARAPGAVICPKPRTAPGADARVVLDAMAGVATAGTRRRLRRRSPPEAAPRRRPGTAWRMQMPDDGNRAGDGR